jgi:limonene 1,2-monooxygenase
VLPPRLRFGAFIAPFHPLEENPTLAIQRDLELVEWLDQLDYDEAWIGEHHSGAYELIASPELFIAAASQRTKHIRLGTGVSSLPYHHPLILADRINQLDHLTRGRTMFGAGPGALVSDAWMMGIPVQTQRDRMDEALGVLVRLLRGEEVSHKSDWFELANARLQMTPYSRPSVEMAVANQVSPTGARAAGRHGLGLLSLGATTTAGFNALASNWAIACEQAAEHGQIMDRNAWRLVGPMHVAETREQALADVRFGLDKWIYYFREIANLPLVPEGDDPVQAMIDTGMAVIGTPDDAARRLEQLVEESGGFGAFLFMDHNWAPWEAKKRSYELVARYVFPQFQSLNVNRQASMDWVRSNKAEFTTQVRAAVGARIVQHIQEKGAANIRPEIVSLITGQAPPTSGD